MSVASEEQKVPVFPWGSKKRMNAAPHHPNSCTKVSIRFPDGTSKGMILTEEEVQGAIVAVWALSLYSIGREDANPDRKFLDMLERVALKRYDVNYTSSYNQDHWEMTESQVDYYKFILESSFGIPGEKERSRTRRYTAVIAEVTKEDGPLYATYQFETLAFVETFKMVMERSGKNARDYVSCVLDHAENPDGIDVTEQLFA